MLTREHRLTSSRGFSQAVRRGRRAGTRTLVLHLEATEAEGTGSRVGFVVSKAVGAAVTRNQVKRRLRHLTRERLTALPGSCVLVVRALPAASTASYADLAADFDTALARAGRPRPGPSVGPEAGSSADTRPTVRTQRTQQPRQTDTGAPVR